MRNRAFGVFAFGWICLWGCDNNMVSPDGEVRSCIDLCALTERASQAQGRCVADYVATRGYDVTHPDCVALSQAFDAGNATRQMCDACYGSISVADRDCVDAHDACFASASPRDAGPSMVSVDAGPGAVGVDAGPGVAGQDAGPGSPAQDAGSAAGVDTCPALCALTGSTSSTQANCVTAAVRALGYDVSGPACSVFAATFGAGLANAGQCNSCYSEIAITDAHCAQVHEECY